MIKKIHCFFEQSGTFKNEFKKLGYEAEDYDIENQFNETDYVINIFKEIERAYKWEKSIFDNIKKEDLIIAFFPCIRFSAEIQMAFKGEQYNIQKWSEIRKLENDLRLQKELSDLYESITKLVIVCRKRNLKLIIENPYSRTHYLTLFWAEKPKIIDLDRRLRGDNSKKPTQYWFINIEPKQNMIIEAQIQIEQRSIEKLPKIERSIISKNYAERFIKEFII